MSSDHPRTVGCLTRRDALGLLTASLATVPCGASAARRPHGRLSGIYRSRDSAAAVGRRYLALHPEEASAAELEARVLQDPSIRVALDSSSDSRLRRVLAEKVRLDFLRRDVVLVDGWLLSITEARLCALHALPWPY
jgi:hypothetical protein